MEPSDCGANVLRYGGEIIPYAVRVNPKRKDRIRIHVHSDGAVEVEAPEQASPDAIANAVTKRARWIMRHVAGARERCAHVLPREYVSGEQVFYLGRRYSLKVQDAPRSKRAVKLKGALLFVHTEDRDLVRSRIRAWYRVKARDYFADRIKAVCALLPWSQDPPPFQLQEMKKHWGSCAAGGTVTLNPFLVKAPRECIDYVIAHELCHLREHNHSPEFFKLLSRAMPGWKETKARLDGMAEVLLNE